MAGAIDRNKNRGLIGGKTESEFKPHDPVTRGELAVVVDRLVSSIVENKLK
ncbi:S-layer homology domain-containing protein [Fontibacillus sp. BL9]|uniref:S-layer homology domain-containing protein n=1 Tax=Fontibacillus sp. BL9 TaxID=3389971 RepID=UPI00397B8139